MYACMCLCMCPTMSTISRHFSKDGIATIETCQDERLDEGSNRQMRRMVPVSEAADDGSRFIRSSSSSALDSLPSRS